MSKLDEVLLKRNQSWRDDLSKGARDTEKENETMKVRDKTLRVSVDVKEANCVKDGRKCYWPRPDPGVFTKGQGYSWFQQGQESDE